MSDERLDLWLGAAGFDELDDPIGAEPLGAQPVGTEPVGDGPAGTRAPGDDPWTDADLPARPLTDAQRAFVEATSPGLGAALGGGALLARRPFDELGDDEIERADDDVIDFDD